MTVKKEMIHLEDTVIVWQYFLRVLINEPVIAEFKSRKMEDTKSFFWKEALHIFHFPQIATSLIPLSVVEKPCHLQNAFCSYFLILVNLR